MKNIKSTLAVIVAGTMLVGCNSRVSGRFDGTYAKQEMKPPMTVTIASDGDHYNVHIEHFNDFVTPGGVTKDYTAKEIDQYTAVTAGGEWNMHLSKDGKALYFGGASRPLIRQ